ncbi:hypothetical protein ACFL6I_23285 [candidate division KSB1 bacterium]
MKNPAYLLKAFALPIVFALNAGCSHVQNISTIRDRLIRQLGPGNGAVIRCRANRMHPIVESVRAMARIHYKSLYPNEEPEITVAEEGSVVCAKASRSTNKD